MFANVGHQIPIAIDLLHFNFGSCVYFVYPLKHSRNRSPVRFTFFTDYWLVTSLFHPLEMAYNSMGLYHDRPIRHCWLLYYWFTISVV